MKWIKNNLTAWGMLLAVGVILLAGMNSAAGHNAVEQKRVAEDNLRKAVVSCYALEGRYPPDVAYLQQNYGLQWNEKKYVIHYEIFAENIMPEITVTER